MEKSAVVEHAWENHHQIHWDKTKVISERAGAVGEGGPVHPDDTPRGALQPDGGLEVSGCWTTVIRKQGGRSNILTDL